MMGKYFVTLLFLGWCTAHLAAQVVYTDFIHVDQFGYRPDATKVAVVSDPHSGFNASENFSPTTAADGYELRDYTSNLVVFKGTLQAWNNGAIDPSSGDKAWWFDFSSFNVSGLYYIYDTGNKVSSFPFSIKEDVYADVLRVAMRMFYYNRCNHAKLAMHAGEHWADEASFVGAHQDTEARSVHDRDNPATSKDLSGGWWDAGDYNKYVTFARSALHNLLFAYSQKPAIWGDNYKIPESGNGIPDILDEIKWEIDWLKKMQLEDGSSLIKMGTLSDSDAQAALPPSTDSRKRFYYPDPCSAATITQASVLAHASLIFKNIPALAEYADDLKDRAIRAYNHYTNHAKNDNCDSGLIQAGDADLSLEQQEQTKIQSAVFLYALTGEDQYKNFVDANYTSIRMIKEFWWGPYDSDLGDALMFYTSLNGISPSVKEDILTKRKEYSQDTDLYKFDAKDPYRSHMKDYVWGSNMTRANISNINYDFVTYQLSDANSIAYASRAEEILHYFHGVNPFNMVYLTNMYAYGAEKSANEIYHSWFKDKSDWDNAKTSSQGGPPPGYLPGGPNKYYADGNGSCTLLPPCNQPPQKSYKDWNGIWPDASWAVTEPAIYYQAAYIKALSKFATLATHELQLTAPAPVTGTSEKKSEVVNVYPNPSAGVFYISDINSSDVSLDLTDVYGNLLSNNFTYHPLQNRLLINLRGLRNGIYFLHIKTQGFHKVAKIQLIN